MQITQNTAILPHRIEYAHQMRPDDGQNRPFDIKWAYVTWKRFPADDVDPVPTFQILFQGNPISEAMATPEEAIASATYWLMDQSRAEFNRGMVGPLNKTMSL